MFGTYKSCRVCPLKVASQVVCMQWTVSTSVSIPQTINLMKRIPLLLARPEAESCIPGSPTMLDAYVTHLSLLGAIIAKFASGQQKVYLRGQVWVVSFSQCAQRRTGNLLGR